MEKSDAGVLHLELDAMFGEQPAGARAAAAPPPAAASPARAAEDRKQQPKTYTILVVDDNKDYRDIVRHLLTVHHFKVVEAVDGSEALGIILKSAPDLALVDFNMPKMNGYELIQEVRSNYELRSMRIIMFTGASNRQHLKTLNMDISDFLEKPVPNAKLLESVKKALGMLPKPAPARPAPERPAPAPGPELPEEPLEPTPSSMAELEIERFEMPEDQAHRGPELQAEPAPARAPVRVELPREPISLPEQPPAPEPELPAEPAPAAGPELLPEPEEEAVEEVPEMDQVFTAEDTHELEVIDSEAERKAEDQQMAGIEALEKDSPLIQMVNKILVKAVELRASDI
ncbi:MAG: response regulator, partial [Elusimicrobia bacterium]|nr:response regulator [Elusimicrobiota bacterium]